VLLLLPVGLGGQALAEDAFKISHALLAEFGFDAQDHDDLLM
jgi:hypothetical protein